MDTGQAKMIAALYKSFPESLAVYATKRPEPLFQHQHASFHPGQPHQFVETRRHPGKGPAKESWHPILIPFALGTSSSKMDFF